MVTAFALLLAASVSGQPQGWTVVRPNPELALERVKACGFAHVSLRQDNELQAAVIDVSGDASATDAQLRCVIEASDSSITYVVFAEPLNSRYMRFVADSEERSRQAQARASLDRRGLLARVPKYEAGETDVRAFAKSLERLCGKSASGAFGVEYGIFTIRPAWLQSAMERYSKSKSDAFECLVDASTVAGFKLGFVGNEAYAPEGQGLAR